MLQLSFDDSCCLSSLSSGGVEFATPGKPRLFTILFRDFAGNPYRFSRQDFRKCSLQQKDNIWHLRFSDTPLLAGMEVLVTVSADAGKSLWHLEVLSLQDEISVEWISFPELPLRKTEDMKFLLPYAEGTLLDDPAGRQSSSSFPCREADFPLTGVSSFYPGPAAVQFEACYTAGGQGLYFGTEDPLSSPKTIDFMPDGENSFYPFLQHFTGGKRQISYDTVIREFSGNWQDAAEIYREFLERSGILPEKLEKRAPQWLMAPPVLLIYPVKGSGSDHGDMSFNGFYPYDRALPLIREFHDLWQNPVMPLLMHWEGTAPWAPPYVWPPAGGVTALEKFIQELHRNGDRIGLYCSGISWTQQSMIERDYDRRREFEDKKLKNEICRGPRGEAFAKVCNGLHSQRIGYELCPSRQFTIDTVCSQVTSAAEIGVDYLQYFDQNQGCTSPLCYNKDHDHGKLPDHRQTAAMQNLLSQARNAAGKMILGCENAAAESYIDVCMLNDLRSHLAWGAYGRPVPLYPYLFHEYVAGFTGNGVCLNAWIDFEKTPFFLQWTIAWNFVCGNLLAAVLKDNGDIHWNWGNLWSNPAPEQKPLKTLIGNLCQWRKNAANAILSRGKMIRTPEIKCTAKEVFTTDGRVIRLPAVEAAAWQVDDREELLLVNYNCDRQAAEITFPGEVSGKIYYPGRENPFSGTKLTLEIPALDAVLIKINQSKQRRA